MKLLLVLCGALLPWPSCKPHGLSDEESCSKACNALFNCGLLPSLLGVASEGVSALENCIERCERTPNDGRKPIVDCSQSAFDTGNDWCTGSACAELSACLRGQFPNVPVAGLGSIQVEAWRVCDRPSSAMLLNDCDVGGALVSGRCPWFEEAQTYCESLPDSTVRAFVSLPEGRRYGPARSCTDGLRRKTAFSDLPTGLLAVGVRIVEAPAMSFAGTAGESGAPGIGAGAETARALPRACHEFTNKVVVRAGADGDLAAVVVAPNPMSGEPCEVCEDQADNDANGLTDCEDGKCALECTPTTSLSGAGGHGGGAQ